MIDFFLAVSGEYTGDVRQVTALALPEDAVPELEHPGWVAEGVVDKLRLSFCVPHQRFTMR